MKQDTEYILLCQWKTYMHGQKQHYRSYILWLRGTKMKGSSKHCKFLSDVEKADSQFPQRTAIDCKEFVPILLAMVNTNWTTNRYIVIIFVKLNSNVSYLPGEVFGPLVFIDIQDFLLVSFIFTLGIMASSSLNKLDMEMFHGL